jgi:acyl dehydratase
MKPLRDLAVGDALPTLDLAPVTRAQLALFAGASGDHNPIHIDLDYARSVGESDVFAHGMLVMAELGRLVTGLFPIGALRAYSARFAAITRVHDQLVCRGAVAAIDEVGGERRATLDLSVTDQAGEIKVVGTAVVALPSA